MTPDATNRPYTETPPPDPPAPPVLDDVFWAGITGNTSLGSGRWSYTFTEREKTVAAYGGWTVLSGGRASTAYNAMEDVADQAPAALAAGTIVRVRETELIGQTAPEYWIIASVPGGGGGGEWTATITHSIRIVAGTAAGSHKISDDDLRGKLILHSAFGNDSSSMYADWPGCAALEDTQPICHVVGNPPAFDDQLQWNLTATGGLGLKVESTDGKLYWTWSQDNAEDQYGFCEVKVRSGTVDTTAN